MMRLHPAPTSRRCRPGLTLVELMVVVALALLVALLAAPSLRDMIELRRLRGVNAQLVTDLQFARSEAVRRNLRLVMHFDQNDSMSCYIIYAGPNTCDCTGTPGSACNSAVTTEVRTVQVPRSDSVRLDLTAAPDQPRQLLLDNVAGGLMAVLNDVPSPAVDPFYITFRGDRVGQLRTSINPAGRISVCSPGGSVSGVDSCS